LLAHGGLLPVEEARRDDLSRRCAYSSLARSAISLACLSRLIERRLLRRLRCSNMGMMLNAATTA